MMKMVDLIMLYAPVGLCAYFASLVGQFGPQLIGAYGRRMLLYYPLCVVYFVVAFAAYAWYSGGKFAVKKFFGNILPPAVTSLATQSSIATLPVNIEAADRIGVPKHISVIVLPICATMHMDGSVLAAVLKISTDALLGYPSQHLTDYDDRYKIEGYYWGLEPNALCYEIMRRKPPVKPYRVLEIGCGEGKDAVKDEGCIAGYKAP